jgi:inosose dehydratase
MAGYTFVKFDLDKTLETLKKTDVHYLCIKDFHLPFASTDEEIAAFHAKLKANDVTGYAVGPIYMKQQRKSTVLLLMQKELV